MALTTVPNVKLALGITAATEDAKLTMFLNAADAGIKKALGRDIESATYTEYYNGNGLKRLVLRQYPVTSITSVYEDFAGYWAQGDSTPFGSDTLLTVGTDYALEYTQGTASYPGVLVRINNVWPAGIMTPAGGGGWGFTQSITGTLAAGLAHHLGNVKVVYVAGYTTVPEDLAYLCIQTVANMRRTIKFGGSSSGTPSSESLGEYSVSMMAQQTQFAMMEVMDSRKILYRYREQVV